MQSSNSFYYRIEWTENKEIGKANAIRILSSVFKISTVIFVVIAGFSFMNVSMLVGFSVGAAACLIIGVVSDYVAGTLIYSYVYALSDGVLELKKEYKNGKSKTYMKSDCKDLYLQNASEGDDNGESFFSESNDNGGLNYCFIKNGENVRIKLAVDDYMLAVLRRSCK